MKTVRNFLKNHDNLVLIFLVAIHMICLRITAEYPKEFFDFAVFLIDTLSFLFVQLGLMKLWDFFQSIPFTWIVLTVNGIHFFTGLLVLLLFRRQIKESAEIFRIQPIKVLNIGLAFWAGFILLVLTYFISIIGFPIAMFLLVLLFILHFWGSLGLSVAFGQFVGRKLKINITFFASYLLGSFLLILGGSILVFGGTFVLFVYPVISVGITVRFIDLYIIRKMRFS
ncbi:MAG: hypothetical protein KHZ62_04150 [Clostridiales bacterium]|nr:hypothetical protein [Clostridiales bacterium]